MSILLHVGIVHCRECEMDYMVDQTALTSLKCCPFCEAERTFTEEDVEEARQLAALRDTTDTDPKGSAGPKGWVN